MQLFQKTIFPHKIKTIILIVFILLFSFSWGYASNKPKKISFNTSSYKTKQANIEVEINSAESNYNRCINGSISFAGEKDYYTFIGKVGEKVNFYLKKESGNSLNLKVFKPDSSLLTTSNFNSSDIETGYQTISGSGTYTIVVDAAGSTTCDYKLSLLKSYVQHIKFANESQNLSLTSNISTEGEQDYYSFFGQKGEKINFYLMKEYRDYLSLKVLKPDKSYLTSQNFNSSDIETDYQTLSETGNYTIIVDASGSRICNYTIYLLKRHDQFISDSSTCLTNFISLPGEKKFFSVKVKKGETFSVFLYNDYKKYLGVSIVNSEDSFFIKKGFSSSNIELNDIIFPEDGSYIIVVDTAGKKTCNFTMNIIRNNAPVPILNMQDAINAANVLTGITSQFSIDINNDNYINLNDLILILQSVSNTSNINIYK